MYFKLFSNCIPVKGATRSTICDLQRGNTKFIPNGLYQILTEYQNCSIEKIKADFEEEAHLQIDKYIQFLIDHNLGFWCDNPEEFPSMDLTWDDSSVITNAILDVDLSSQYDIVAVLNQLNELHCVAADIRFFVTYPFDKLNKIMKVIKDSNFRSITLYLKYSINYEEEQLKKIIQNDRRINTIIIHSAPESKEVSIENEFKGITYTKEKIKNETHCGVITQDYLTPNIPLFTENHHFNSCLNRKVAVDKNGEIKNCPSMSVAYGNIKDTTLKQAIEKEGFKNTWTIKKDEIEVCKDCEFRYICTDCRAYIQNPENKYSKPAKCSYNPYTMKWEN